LRSGNEVAAARSVPVEMREPQKNVPGTRFFSEMLDGTKE